MHLVRQMEVVLNADTIYNITDTGDPAKLDPDPAKLSNFFIDHNPTDAVGPRCATHSLCEGLQPALCAGSQALWGGGSRSGSISVPRQVHGGASPAAWRRTWSSLSYLGSATATWRT